MPKYKVPATMGTNLYLMVNAKDADEAYDIAKNTDGACFMEEEGINGDWRIGEPMLISEEDDPTLNDDE